MTFVLGLGVLIFASARSIIRQWKYTKRDNRKKIRMFDVSFLVARRGGGTKKLDSHNSKLNAAAAAATDGSE